jgi:hypothetical protein
MNAKRRPTETARAGVVLFTLAALTMQANPAAADTPAICVTSNVELAAALALAQTRAVSIELMQGAYDLKSTVWDTHSSASSNETFFAGSSLSGGYLNASCTAQNIDRDNTIIADSSTTPNDAFLILGDATIQGITFHLTNGLTIVSGSTGLPAGTQLTLRRNVFTRTITNAFSPISILWSAASSSGGTIRLVNNLFYENSSSSDVGAVLVSVSGGKPTIEAINNTIENNGGMMEGMVLEASASTVVYAYNNIFYGNGGLDLDITASNNVALTNNTVGTHSYPNTATVTGAKSGDPKLDSNYEPITSPVSPSINTGVSSVVGGLPSTDLPGNPRQIGSEPDRGAYESNVNDLTTHVVTNTLDSGAGSLRDAITQSNTNNVATRITFNLGNACPYTISPASLLPQMTAPITIDGYSQAGATPNDLGVGNDASLCVILDGSAHGLGDGLVVSSAADDSVAVRIDGIAFSGFSHGAVTLSGGSGHVITGSRVGGAVGNVSLDPVANGVIIGPGVHDVTIGGDTGNPALMNILGSATGSAVVMDGPNATVMASHDNLVFGNYIGVGWNTNTSAYTNRGNGGAGVLIAGPNNSVTANYIEFNGGYGVELTGADATNTEINVNNIGYLDSEVDTGSGNHGGIVVENDASQVIICCNNIWFNLGTGVRVLSGVGTDFNGNSIWSNSLLAIDLGNAGVDANDDDSKEPAGYPNNGLNYPVITRAIGGHTKGHISGTFTSKPGPYSVTLYASQTCNASGNGEGQYSLTSDFVQVPVPVIGGQATAAFDIDLSGFDFADNPVITALAQDSSGDTSEFSQCFNYIDDTIFADGFGN